MPPPPILTSFLSVSPHEPVLVFSSSKDAATFQSVCKQGRILSEQNAAWVFLPLPHGLLRVRTTKSGDIAFDFSREEHSKAWNDSIKGAGRIYSSTKEKAWGKTVYLGKPLI